MTTDDTIRADEDAIYFTAAMNADEPRDLHWDQRCDLRDGSCGHRSISDCVESRVGWGR